MFHLKYRPETLDEFVGNASVIASVKRDIASKQKPPTYLFFGIRGCGKTSLANVLAKELGGRADSIYTYNAANDKGIDTAREIIDRSKNKHVMGHHKVFILDEAHKVTGAAQSALLTWAEQPPKGVYLILCSTAPEKILKELRDRCIQYEMRPLVRKDQEVLFDYVSKKEGLSFSDKVKNLILEYNAEGRPRKLLMDMYRCRLLNKSKEVKAVLDGVDDAIAAEAIEIARMLLNPRKLEWSAIISLVDGLTAITDVEGIRRMLFAYYSKVLRGARTKEQITYAVYILEMLDTTLEDNSQGLNSLIYLLGKIYLGVLSVKG